MITTTILKIWNFIVETNVFNFVIFAAIIIYIFKKINVKQMVDNLQESIVKIIENTKQNKEKSETALKEAQKSIENLPSVLEEIVQDAQKSAEVISNKIQEETAQQIDAINNNADKTITAEEKFIISNLIKEASLKSVEHAEKQIKFELLKDVSLHEKYIKESIDELDRLKF